MSGARRLQTRGLTVNIRIEGSGPPLLFLGGSNFDLAIRAPVFDSVLTQHFTVAAADPRGLGYTDAPEGDWSMGDYAGDCKLILDALGWDRVDILGESFGAMTALHLAAMHPDCVNRMALVGGSPGGLGGSSYPIHEFGDIEDLELRARTALGIMDVRYLDECVDAPELSEHKVQDRIKSQTQFLASHKNAENHPRLLKARATHDAWSLLPDINAPTLVFSGRYDRQAPVDRAQNIVKSMPNAKLFVVEAGHSLCFATPETVETIVENWTS